MKPGASGWTLAAALLGVAWPVAVFWLATPAELRASGLVIHPFGWWRILLPHLLAALPLSFYIAHQLLQAVRTTRLGMEVGVYVALGIIAASISLTWGADLGHALGLSQATFATRVTARATWCVLLQLPWCMLGLCLRGPAASFLQLPAWLTSGFTLVTATVLPAIYSTTLVEDQSRRMNELMGRGRYLRAQQSIVGLEDLVPPPELARTIADLQRAVAQPLRPPMPRNAVLQRARMLAALDRIDEARQLVQPLVDDNPDAGLFTATLDQDQHNWTASNAAFRAVLHELIKRPDSDQVKLWRVDAFDGLAYNAREQQDYNAAIAIYHEALTSVPGAEAYYHFQLGRQLHQAGRPTDALNHLQTASRLSPEPYAKLAAPLINDIRSNTVGCFLTSSWGRPRARRSRQGSHGPGHPPGQPDHHARRRVRPPRPRLGDPTAAARQGTGPRHRAGADPGAGPTDHEPRRGARRCRCHAGRLTTTCRVNCDWKPR